MYALPLILNAANILLMSATIVCILVNWKALTSPVT